MPSCRAWTCADADSGGHGGAPRREEWLAGTVTFDDPAWLAEERRWLEAFGRGDGRAFDHLFQAFASPLYYRILLPRLGDPAAAEDALGETFRKAFERLPRFEDRGKGLWPYLVTIATNQANDVHRQRARQGRALGRWEALVAPLLPAAVPGPDQDLGTDVRAAVEEVLAVINPRYRRALELRFFEERGREECAALLAVKVGTFDVLLLRALRSFREHWPPAEAAAAVAKT
jgi:RNA polymerase sigma factor (sigma-70 family)